jgi:hypothetical protein
MEKALAKMEHKLLQYYLCKSLTFPISLIICFKCDHEYKVCIYYFA